jgi:hypothetical protein
MLSSCGCPQVRAVIDHRGWQCYLFLPPALYLRYFRLATALGLTLVKSFPTEQFGRCPTSSGEPQNGSPLLIERFLFNNLDAKSRWRGAKNSLGSGGDAVENSIMAAGN